MVTLGFGDLFPNIKPARPDVSDRQLPFQRRDNAAAPSGSSTSERATDGDTAQDNMSLDIRGWPKHQQDGSTKKKKAKVNPSPHQPLAHLTSDAANTNQKRGRKPKAVKQTRRKRRQSTKRPKNCQRLWPS
mmetsp:Transcript_7794/g.21727  ORF Transcript_7794/g.21727 Transcript_7794/m.21727 type:complete len:131 (-) Transcript_7794:303-695(-)